MADAGVFRHHLRVDPCGMLKLNAEGWIRHLGGKRKRENVQLRVASVKGSCGA